MKKSTTAKRLRMLADYLDTVKPKVFNMYFWWTGPLKSNCGTTACALGHAATMPYFYKLGLRLVAESLCSPTCEPCNRDPMVKPVFRGKEQLHAAEAVFGVTYEESFFLFVGGGNESPKGVAKKLRKVAEQYDAR